MFSPDAFSSVRVLVVGDVMLDRYWYGDVDRISPEAPVPVVGVTNAQERAGGAANVAQNVTALGAQCTLLSAVGDDEPGKKLTEVLRNSGAKLLLHKDGDMNTTVKLRIISRNQQLLRADFEKRPSHEILSACLSDFRRVIADVDIIIISDYGKGGLLHIKEMIGDAKKHNIPVIVDPKGSDFGRYHGATAITPNTKEFSQVVGPWENEMEFRALGHRLLNDSDSQYVLVTRSEQGMSLFRRDGSVIDSPARAREVFDVSGAGDTVVSAFAVSHAAGFEDELKLRIANAAAGIVVGKLGTATATQHEILADMQAVDT